MSMDENKPDEEILKFLREITPSDFIIEFNVFPLLSKFLHDATIEILKAAGADENDPNIGEIKMIDVMYHQRMNNDFILPAIILALTTQHRWEEQTKEVNCILSKLTLNGEENGEQGETGEDR